MFMLVVKLIKKNRLWLLIIIIIELIRDGEIRMVIVVM